MPRLRKRGQVFFQLLYIGAKYKPTRFTNGGDRLVDLGSQGGVFATQVEQRNREKAEGLLRAHPHSVYLYVLACTGAIGGVLFLAVTISLIRQCWRDPPDHLYADGAFIVLIGWFIGAAFDCYNLNGHMFGILTMVVAVTLSGRRAVGADSGSNAQTTVA